MGKSRKGNIDHKGAYARMLTDERITILIFTDPGLLRDSIFTILASITNVKLVDIPTSERYYLNEIKQLHPDIILFDSDTHQNFTELIQAIKIYNAGIMCVAISGSVNTNKLTLKDRVDYILLKGFTRRELHRIVQEVFLQKQALCSPTDIAVLDKIEAFHEYQ